MNTKNRNRYSKYFDKYTDSHRKENDAKYSEDTPFYAKVDTDTEIQVTFNQFKLICTFIIIAIQSNTLYKYVEPNFTIKTYDQLLQFILLIYFSIFGVFLNWSPLKPYFNWLTIKVAPAVHGMIWFQFLLSSLPPPESLRWFNSGWGVFWMFCHLHQSAFAVTVWEFRSLHLNKLEHVVNIGYDLLCPIIPLLTLDFTRWLTIAPPLIAPIFPVANPSLPSIFQLKLSQLAQIVLISITTGIIWTLWLSFVKFQYRALVWKTYLIEGYLIFKTQNQYKLAKII